MNIVNHLGSIIIIGVKKLHCIPKIIASPILPVLNNTIKWNIQLTIFTYYTNKLVLSAITFLTLKVTITPQRKHRHLPSKSTHLCNNAISIAAIHEVVINTFAHFRIEACTGLIIGKRSRRIIVPKESVTFHRLKESDKVFRIALNHVFCLIALTHLTCLQLSQAVDSFILIEFPCLTYPVIAFICTILMKFYNR